MLGLTGLVGHVWFGLVNGYHLKRPLVPLKEVIASIELNFGTIPGRVGPGRVGPIVIIRLCSAQLELELG